MLRVFLLVSLLVLGLVVTGCSGDSGDPQRAGSTAAAGAPTADREVAEALRAFVEAAGNGDANSMWQLLSSESQAELGPTQEAFTRKLAPGFQTGVGSFAGTGYQVVLSATMPSGFGVAAIAGERVRQGKPEYAAFGAALRRQDGAWKLELGDAVELRNLEPASLETTDRNPQVAVRIRANTAVEEAGVWLDGAPLPATIRGTDGRDIIVGGRPEQSLSTGWHVIVSFGRAGDLATAGATRFEVKAEDSGTVA
jgi:hypothetical protein